MYLTIKLHKNDIFVLKISKILKMALVWDIFEWDTSITGLDAWLVGLDMEIDSDNVISAVYLFLSFKFYLLENYKLCFNLHGFLLIMDIWLLISLEFFLRAGFATSILFDLKYS